MKVLVYAPANTACQPYLIAQALVAQGCDARDVIGSNNYIEYPCTYHPPTDPIEKQMELLEWWNSFDPKEDIVLFNSVPQEPNAVEIGLPLPKLDKEGERPEIVIDLRKQPHVWKLHGTDAYVARKEIVYNWIQHGAVYVTSPDPRMNLYVKGVPWIPPVMDPQLMKRVRNNSSWEPPKSWNGAYIIGHTATDQETKGTQVLTSAMTLLKDQKGSRKVITDIVMNVGWKDSLAHKERFDICYGQVYEPWGYYGLSEVEAMMMGVPVAGLVSDMTLSQYPELPLWNVRTHQELAELVTQILTDQIDVKAVAREQRKYALRVHGMDRVGRQWAHLLRWVVQKRRFPP